MTFKLSSLFGTRKEALPATGGNYSRETPSPRYLELSKVYATMHDEGRPDVDHSAGETFDGRSLEPHIDIIAKLLKDSGSKTVLDYGSGKGKLYQPRPDAVEERCKRLPAWEGAEITCYDPGYDPFSELPSASFDAVISTDVVEHIPELDIPWILDEMFSRAEKQVYVVAACYPAKKILPDGSNAHCTVKQPAWWIAQMEAAAKRRGQLDWTLCTQSKSFFSFEHRSSLRKPGTKTLYFSG